MTHMTTQEAPPGASVPSALVPFDIGHPDYVAMIAPDSAFWSLLRHDSMSLAEPGGSLALSYAEKAAEFEQEMQALRFQLKPSAVYFNATERCNLNCSYCYIPADLRRGGSQMGTDRVMEALARLEAYFATTVPEGHKPQIIFHGAEPLLAKEALFAAIDAYKDRFRFGVQTNATLLDDATVAFLTSRGVSIGLSLDGADPAVADRTRKKWNGEGVHASTLAAIDRLRGYTGFSVICTMTKGNLGALTDVVEFLHGREVPACMLNVVRCTLPGAREVWAEDMELAKAYVAALERSHALYRETGRKIVVANFANILIAILAPTARRLMCDISPCGGGRSFFALAPDGDLFPCSEFIGLPDFAGGNLFRDRIEDVLDSAPFRKVTERKVEDIAACAACPIRHFCGSPCPAEAHEMRGGMDKIGAYCGFYQEQVRYAFRLIVDGRADDFLWNGWDAGTEITFSC